MKTVTHEPTRPAVPPLVERGVETDLLVAYMALKSHAWGAMVPASGDLAALCLAAQAFVREIERDFPTLASAMERRNG